MPNAELSKKVAGRDPHKRCIIFKKTSTSRSGNLAGYIRRYLDETKKRENSINPDGSTGANVANRLQQGKDYVTKHEQGRVHVHGFLREEIYKECGKHPHELEAGELTTVIPNVWKRKIREKSLKKTAHKIAFALDPEICEMMMMAGIPVDETLLGIVNTTFKNYAEEFYPGQELGYLAGIHHDKKHVHAHVLLYPQTDQGTPINISHHSKRRLSNGRVVRIDFQGFLKDTVERLTRRMYLDKVRRVAMMQDRPTDVKAQSKMILLTAIRRTRKEMPTTADPQGFWSRVLSVRKQLEGSVGGESHNVVEQEVRATYEERLQNFNQLSPENAQAVLDRALEARDKLKKEQEAANKTFASQSKERSKNNPWKALQVLRRECFRAKKLVLKGKELNWSVPAFLQHAEGKWFLRRMEQKDELGKTLRQVFVNYSKEMDAARDRDEYRRDIKDAFGKRAITSVVRPGWVTRQAALKNQLAILDRVQKELTKKAQEQIEQELKNKHAQKELRRRNLVKLQLLEIEILDAGSKLKGKKPVYLQQYEAWKATGTKVPLEITAIPSKDKETADAETKESAESLLDQYITRTETPAKEPPLRRETADEILAKYITIDHGRRHITSPQIVSMTKEELKRAGSPPLTSKKLDPNKWSKEETEKLIQHMFEDYEPQV